MPPRCAVIDAPATVQPGQPVTLRARLDTTLSNVQYTWDFGSSDNASDQTTGTEVATRYYTGGKDYTVTLTVRDLDGLKQSVQATKVIHVAEDMRGGPNFQGPPGYQGPPGFPVEATEQHRGQIKSTESLKIDCF